MGTATATVTGIGFRGESSHPPVARGGDSASEATVSTSATIRSVATEALNQQKRQPETKSSWWSRLGNPRSSESEGLSNSASPLNTDSSSQPVNKLSTRLFPTFRATYEAQELLNKQYDAENKPQMKQSALRVAFGELYGNTYKSFVEGGLQNCFVAKASDGIFKKFAKMWFRGFSDPLKCLGFTKVDSALNWSVKHVKDGENFWGSKVIIPIAFASVLFSFKAGRTVLGAGLFPFAVVVAVLIGCCVLLKNWYTKRKEAAESEKIDQFVQKVVSELEKRYQLVPKGAISAQPGPFSEFSPDQQRLLDETMAAAHAELPAGRVAAGGGGDDAVADGAGDGVEGVDADGVARAEAARVAAEAGGNG
jgi:hypothetical protein